MESLFLLKYSHLAYSSYRLSSTSVKPSIISRVRYVLNHYWLGSKLLYRNSRAIQQIKKKDENSLSRLDHLSLEQFRYDIRVGVPFVALFSIPILGYTAPLLAIIAPKYLPSTLIMPTQKVRFLKEDANASSSIIDSFMKFNQTQYSDMTIYGMISFMQFISQICDSNDRFNGIMSSIPEYSSLFTKSYPLSSFSRQHLLLLHQSVLHSSFVARFVSSNYSLESQLEMWQYRTLIDDQRIRNPDQLSPFQLVSALYNRGLYLHTNEMGKVFENDQKNNLNQTKELAQVDNNILNDWKQLLSQWIEIHRKLYQLNSSASATTFLLHISPLLVRQ